MLGIILGTIAVVLTSVVIGLLIDRKVKVLPAPEDLAPKRKQLAGHAAGESPASALRLRGTQIDALRTSQRCPDCRAAMHAGDDDTARFGDDELLVLHFTCSACTRARTLYVVRLER